jgi:tetratricopeptide (TPR) repeat protein
VDIRSARVEDRDGSMTDAAYEDAFREAGFDIAALIPAEMAAKIQARPAAVREALVAALDDWAVVRADSGSDQVGAGPVTGTALLADRDPWRNRLRGLLKTSQSHDRLKSLKDLASSARIEDLPTVSLHLLGGSLLDSGDPTGAETVLRAAERHYPSDLWINLILARCLEQLGRREEAIRYYIAARSLRPEAAHALAHALAGVGET